MNRPFFAVEDFSPSTTLIPTSNAVAIANKLLEERGTIVYSYDEYRWIGAQISGPNKGDTHQAILVNIQDLPKKECEHDGFESEVRYEGIKHIHTKYRCKNCGVELKPEWKVK